MGILFPLSDCQAGLLHVDVNKVKGAGHCCLWKSAQILNEDIYELGNIVLKDTFKGVKERVH